MLQVRTAGICATPVSKLMTNLGTGYLTRLAVPRDGRAWMSSPCFHGLQYCLQCRLNYKGRADRMFTLAKTLKL